MQENYWKKFKFQISAWMTNGAYPIHLLTKLVDVRWEINSPPNPTIWLKCFHELHLSESNAFLHYHYFDRKCSLNLSVGKDRKGKHLHVIMSSPSQTIHTPIPSPPLVLGPKHVTVELVLGPKQWNRTVRMTKIHKTSLQYLWICCH